MSTFDAHLADELARLAASDLLREPRDEALPESTLILCSNDYLGYAREPAATIGVDAVPSGAGASRLISGDHPHHRSAEAAIAEWLGYEAALLVSSGYAANVGVMSSLPGPEDIIFSDALNHASIIDGCRLSRGRVVVTDHASVEALEAALDRARSAPGSGSGKRWIVTESYFSMNGDTADLAALRRLADRYDAFLIVDEAHALGVFGAGGRGLCQEANVRPDVLVGTLGKALGLAGAFVVGSASLRSTLWNRARSFVFSTGVAPWLAAAAIERVRRVEREDDVRTQLWDVVREVRSGLERQSVPVAPSVGPIVPIVVGDAKRVVELRDELLACGVFVQAIRPPTVPDGTSRLRLTLHAKMTASEIARALRAIASCLAPPKSRSRDAESDPTRLPPPNPTS